jgi:hypothetical protein
MGDDGGHRPILCIVGVVVSATVTVTTITVTAIAVTSARNPVTWPTHPSLFQMAHAVSSETLASDRISA